MPELCLDCVLSSNWR